MAMQACKLGENKHVYSQKIARNRKPTKNPFPLSPLDTSLLPAGLGDATHCRDFLRLSKVIPLEMTSQSTLSFPSAVRFLQGTFYILDPSWGLVLTFDENGAFQGVLGHKGEGPGEYQNPETVEVIWQDHLAVADLGSLLVYDAGGTFVKKVTIRTDGWAFDFNSHFIWETEDRLAIGSFNTVNPENPKHVILKHENNRFTPYYGFGERHPEEARFERFNIPVFDYSCFGLIGGNYWVGSPYSATLEIYDAEARFLGTLKRAYAEQLVPSDFSDIKSMDDTRGLYVQVRNFINLQVDGLVLSYLTGNRVMHVNVYDTHGNLLHHDLPNFHSILWPLTSHGRKLVCLIPILGSEAEYRQHLNEDEMASLRAAGFDVDNLDDMNPALAIFELKE